jgi:hypothetical protein
VARRGAGTGASRASGSARASLNPRPSGPQIGQVAARRVGESGPTHHCKPPGPCGQGGRPDQGRETRNVEPNSKRTAGLWALLDKVRHRVAWRASAEPPTGTMLEIRCNRGSLWPAAAFRLDAQNHGIVRAAASASERGPPLARAVRVQRSIQVALLPENERQ